MLKSVLNVLFTEKQLKNIISLGEWQSHHKFKLPTFYFKDRHTLAFPCQEEENQEVQQVYQKGEGRDYSS